MKTIIKDSKPVSAKMLSMVCIFIPLLCMILTPACKFGLGSFAAFVLLACAEMIVLPAVFDSLRSTIPAFLIFVQVVPFLLSDISLSWPLTIIQSFLLSFIILSKRPVAMKEIIYELIGLASISITSNVLLMPGYGFEALALLLALLIYFHILYCQMTGRRIGLGFLDKMEANGTVEDIMLPRRRSRLVDFSEDVEEMRHMMERVELLMKTEKPFLSETYCLMDMAAAVYTNKTYLSKTINMLTGKNFRQYINSYRVEYAIQLMKNDHRLRVSELSDMSGFHSPVTFGMAFKLNVGETPGEYLQKLKAGLE